jgi:cyanuric acid amidohydrolase
VTFIVRSLSNAHTGLVAAVGHTQDLAPHEIGTESHANLVSSKVKDMMRDLEVKPDNVQLVLVKCPLLTSAKLAAIRAAGIEPLTSDTYESMALSRIASALGVASALDEMPEADVASALQSKLAWSAKASCSSGAELEDNHIFILASDSKADKSGPGLHAISKPMSDAIDAEVVLELLSQVKRDGGRVLQVFAKAEADPRGLVRGSRHTMNTDSDIHSTRHARAAVGGLLAGLTGDPQIYVSGGAEGQGAPGGGSLCVVYETF